MITVRLATTNMEKCNSRHVRRRVFVDEQGVSPKVELDVCTDVYCDHYIAVTDAGEVIGAARGYGCEGSIYKVERVAVLREWRGQHVGEQLMRCIEKVARKQAFQRTLLNAQLRALRFYLSQEYIPFGHAFQQEGIIHIGMKKRLN